MLEKNGSIVLTDDDLLQYHSGSVSDRLQQLWGLSYDQLQEVIATHSYTKADQKND